jgi:hypothetical protein
MQLSEASLGNVSRDITEIRYLMKLVNDARGSLGKSRKEKLHLLRLLDNITGVEKHPTLSDSTIDNWIVSYITDNMSMVDLKVMAFRASYGFEFEPQYVETNQQVSKSLEYE